MKKTVVWTKRGNTRVLADAVIENLQEKPCKIVVEGARGEYESAQILISPDCDVQNYDLELSHIKCKESGYWIYKDCWTVYNQKYMKIEAPSSKDYEYPLGEYPDALLPFEKAKEYGENNVKAGKHQGIWLTLKIPDDQRAGEYFGSFVLTVDGVKYEIPVAITVWDFNVPKEVHLQSDFGVEPNWIKLGENDYLPDMVRKYTEKLMEFRFAPSLLAFKVNSFHSGEEFAKQVRLFHQADKPYLSTIMLPVESHPETGLDKKRFKTFAWALMQASVEDKINYMEKAAVFCNFIDEPQLNGTWEEANRTSRHFEEFKGKIADEFWEAGEQTEFRKAVCDCMRKLKNYVTIHIDERITEVKNYCVSIPKMKTKEQRAQYKDMDSVWWYTCGAGDVPSWVIDHKLLDMRLMAWMSYDYNIKGMLYWETCMFCEWKFCMESHLNHEVIIDCYKQARRISTANGDGYLFYPGKPYGIYGPVESIRLHALRDGMEDYEYLYVYGELCKQAGIDVREHIQELCDTLYEDLNVKADCLTFDGVRRKLAEKIVALKNQING